MSLLHSIESELAEHEWWQDGWVFVRYSEGQVYISHRVWQVADQFAVWIGVEGFIPDKIFGLESAPDLYVWVTHHCGGGLAQKLAQELEKLEEEPLGEIDHRASRYVVRHSVRKCLPEEAEGFGQTVCRQIADFFTHYARVLRGLDEVILDHKKEL